MFDFPANPSIGQPFVVAGITYIFDGIAWNVSAAPNTAVLTANTRNLAVNPALQISQENGTTAVTTAGSYPADQWLTGSTVPFNSGLQTAAAGWNQLYVSNISAKTSLAAGDLVYFSQPIEGVMVKDLGWGNATLAKPAVLCFDTHCTVAGTYCTSIRSSGTPDRSFVALFTLTANTWTTVQIPIPAQTGGTWNSDNTVGMRLDFSLAAGSTYVAPAAGWNNGNYLGAPGMSNGIAGAGTWFYIRKIGLHLDPLATGVAPPFEVPDYGDDLAACKRYWQIVTSYWSGYATSGSSFFLMYKYTVPTRAAPTLTGVNQAASAFPATVGTLGDLGTTDGCVETRVANNTVAAGYYRSNVTVNARM